MQDFVYFLALDVVEVEYLLGRPRLGLFVILLLYKAWCTFVHNLTKLVYAMLKLKYKNLSMIRSRYI